MLDWADNSLRSTVAEYLRSAVEILPTLILAVVIFVLFYIAARLARRAVRRVSRSFVDDESLRTLFATMSFVAVVAGGVFTSAAIVFPGLGAGDLVGVLGLSSVAIGFAFKDIFQNFLAGVLLLTRRPFVIGDQIVTGEHEGTVEEISFRNTQIRTVSGEHIIIPNSDIFTNSVTVLTKQPQRRSSFTATIALGEEIEAAREVILDALASCSEVDAEPEPQVYAWEHVDRGVEFNVRYWTSSEFSSVSRARDQVTTEIKRALDERGIEIPYPHRSLEIRRVEGEARNRRSALTDGRRDRRSPAPS